MSLEVAFEVSRLKKPLDDLSIADQGIHSAYTLLPGLKGFWPMTAFMWSGDVLDISGNGHPLMANGDPVFFGNPGYASFDGSDDAFSHADAPGLDISAAETYIDASMRGLTMGCWSRVPDAAQTASMSKWAETSQQAYKMGFTNFHISQSGSASNFVYFSSQPYDVDAWHFFVGRFDRQAGALDMWCSEERAETVATSYTSIFNSTEPFRIARQQTNYSECDMALAFLCCSALSDAVINNLFQVSRGRFGA